MKLLSYIIILTIFIAIGVKAHQEAYDLGGAKDRRIDGIKLIKGVTIKVNTTSLDVDGGWVNVEFGGVPNPDDKDTLQIFAPSNANFTGHAPVKYVQCADIATKYSHTGTGSTTMVVYNLRTDHIVVLVNKHYIIAMSEPITFTNYNAPLRGHLALTQDPTQISLTWTSQHSQSPVVKYGTQSGQYTSQVKAASKTYTEADMCGSPAADIGYYDPGLIHTAYLTGLKPNQKYYYVYGDTEGWSTEASFLGPKPAGSSGGSSVRLITFGDMGRTEPDAFQEHEIEPGAGQTQGYVASAVQSQTVDAIFHIGDIAYATGYGSEWDAFFTQIQPIAEAVPYMACPGNHEFNTPDEFWINATDSGGECGVVYRSKFDMPLIGSNVEEYIRGKNGLNTSNNWYSVDIGLVHVVMMNTEELFETNSPQLNFIEADLSRVDRSVTPFILFGGHRPMYVDSNYKNPGNWSDQEVAQILREYVEPILYKYKVDLAIWGHHHSYQRSCPVFNQECVSDGTIHMVIGVGGHSISHNLEDTPPAWIEITDVKDFGYIQMDITETAMKVSFYVEKNVKDSVSIPCKFCKLEN